MNSFNKRTDLKLPLGAVWLLNSISEFKGKQELYTKQSPQMLKALLDMAMIESAESSNRIEGVTVDKNRLKPLVLGNSAPRDRSEEEVRGYRRALDLIHKKYETLDITPGVIKKLHYLSHGESGDAGEWKKKDNDIIRKNPDGSIEVIFKPVSAALAPKAVEELCLQYKYAIEQLRYPALYAVACLILDFLSIHPFRDGNGRVARLLTLLALYHHGYEVGKYISLERIIEQSKETYYEALNKSSQQWHEGKHDVEPWFYYFLGIVNSAYKEFEQRAVKHRTREGAKTELIVQAVMNQGKEFSISDIAGECSGISRVMIKLVLEKMKQEGKIK